MFSMVASAVSRGFSECSTAYQAFAEKLKVEFTLSLCAKKFMQARGRLAGRAIWANVRRDSSMKRKRC